MIRTEDFDYNLPEHLIAQFPLEPRDACRLLHLEKNAARIGHHLFRDLPGMLRTGDRLVFNNTRVIPARLFGKKDNGVSVEILFTERVDSHTWKAIVRPGKRLPEGTVVTLDSTECVQIKIAEVLADGGRLISSCVDNNSEVSIDSLIEGFGHIPLPPYITRQDSIEDRNSYQTVFARCDGAVAAPTAGLHFTKNLLDTIKNLGIESSFVTLHVGIGTFRPVKESDPRQHPIHEEKFELLQSTVDEIKTTKANGGRVIAVGTTVVRVLENCSLDGELKAQCGSTRLMILPPFTFHCIDGLITNFHVPRSTLLMLVSAFAGRDAILNAYSEAVGNSYRMLSYGDAMLIL
ncbi:MAG: tRNA preQ1(34) S-adenosylmethionine ribosyltransferase-isomerase QueA [Chitinispirillaceae bacterium]|nr:tRNA preQ1(34) S-adenosylmethionine ribosyltransferase-isomerase QueA [Chitinispirillaceae bacterium]